MARIPTISIQGWTEEGPAYTIHRTLAGWRHRRERRKGASPNANEMVGPHEFMSSAGDLPPDVGQAFMVFAIDDTEVYAFRAGHVYQVELLVDGDAMSVLVDARGREDRLEQYGPDLSLLEWRAVPDLATEPAIESALTARENVSDGAESQEPIVSLTGAQVEEPIDPQQSNLLNPLEGAPGAAYMEGLKGNAASGAEPEVWAEDDESSAAADDGEEPSTSDHDFAGTIADFVELAEAMTEGELHDYSAHDSRKGIHAAAEHEIQRRDAEQAASIRDGEDADGEADNLAFDKEE